MKTKFIFIAVATLALAACGEEKNGQDAEGRCTDPYIASWNKVTDIAEQILLLHRADGTPRFGVTEQQIKSEAKKMDQACDEFLNQYMGTDCKAIRRSTGEVVQTNTAALSETCGMIKSALQGTSSSGEQTGNFFEIELHQMEPIPTDPKVEYLPEDEGVSN